MVNLEVIQIKKRVDYLRLKDGLSYRKISEYLGVTENTLHVMLRNNDCKLSVLVKLAKFFDMDVINFLDEQLNPDQRVKEKEKRLEQLSKDLKNVQKERDLLTQLVDSLKKTITLLEFNTKK